MSFDNGSALAVQPGESSGRPRNNSSSQPMLRSACRRLVLPTTLSRRASVTSPSLEIPAGSGAKDSMPFNNAAERALRGVALWDWALMFAGSDRDGERTAVTYSLIVTVKLNNTDPRPACRRPAPD